MKSEKLDLNNINAGNIGSLMETLRNEPPKGSVLLDKYQLPSRGKFYPNDIYLKKLNTLNIKNLATLNEQNVNNIINGVITSCVWGMEPNKILTGDKIWLIYYLRSITYNDLPFTVRGSCPNCDNICNYKFTLRDLVVSYLDKEIPEYIELPNGDKITITFPTISTDAAVNRLKNDQQIIIDINPELLEMATYILKVNDKTLTLYDAYEYIINISGMDFSVLTNEMSEFIFSAKPIGKFTCPKCGEEILLPVPFTPSFFLPKIK